MTTTTQKQKTRSERRKHCALAVVRPAPPQTPFLGARDGQNLISWRWSLPLPTNSVWWGSMHAISSCRGNRPTHTHNQTNKHTHPHTNRQDRLQYTAPQLASAQCKKKHSESANLSQGSCNPNPNWTWAGSPPKSNPKRSYCKLRNSDCSYVLPQCNSSVFKRSFINWCLFML